MPVRFSRAGAAPIIAVALVLAIASIAAVALVSDDAATAANEVVEERLPTSHKHAAAAVENKSTTKKTAKKAITKKASSKKDPHTKTVKKTKPVVHKKAALKNTANTAGKAILKLKAKQLEQKEERRLVREASHAAVKTEEHRDLSHVRHHLLSKGVEDAASRSFKSAYTRARVHIAMGKEPVKAVSSSKHPKKHSKKHSKQHAKGHKVSWRTKLAWAKHNCIAERAAAVTKCNTAKGASASACNDLGKGNKGKRKACEGAKAAGRHVCHRAHRQAFRVCMSGWKAAHHRSTSKIKVPRRGASSSRFDHQMHTARRKCSRQFAKEQIKCQRRRKWAAHTCRKLRHATLAAKKSTRAKKAEAKVQKAKTKTKKSKKKIKK